MGLLSRLTKKVTPQKKATDDVLLVHAMMLMCGADGSFDDEEIATVEAYFAALPDFKGREFGEVYNDATKLVQRYSNLRDSVKALGGLSTRALKDKCYLIAADIAMSSGDVDENEDQMLDAMQRILEVEDTTAHKIIEVLTMKYAIS